MTAGQTCQDEKQGVNNPDEALAAWYDQWIGKEPERFYAYIKRSSDGAWIGDVNFHYTPEKDWWDMGIVIYAPFRMRINSRNRKKDDKRRKKRDSKV